MADDVTLPGTGSVIAADDISGVSYQRVKLVHGVDGTNAGDVAISNPFPVAQSATNFEFSTVNSTSTNLAASATFTGTVEAVVDQQAVSVIARATQPLSITVNQYQDSGGTVLVVTNNFTVAANTPFARSLVLNGNYLNVVVQNTGASTTTSLVVDTALGTIPVVTQSGNAPIALNEIGGAAFSASGSFADAESNSQVTLPTEAYLMGFNGTTWDRIRLDSQSILRVRAHRDLVRIAVGVTGVTTATTAYTAGDQVGTLVSLTGAARATGGSGTIVAVQLIDQSDIMGAVDVVFSRASITLAADNAAYAISDADSLNVIGLVQLAGAYDIGNNRIAQAYNLAVPYDCSGGTTLYASIITRIGHTFFTAGALPQLVVWVELN